MIQIKGNKMCVENSIQVHHARAHTQSLGCITTYHTPWCIQPKLNYSHIKINKQLTIKFTKFYQTILTITLNK